MSTNKAEPAGVLLKVLATILLPALAFTILIGLSYTPQLISWLNALQGEASIGWVLFGAISLFALGALYKLIFYFTTDHSKD